MKTAVVISLGRFETKARDIGERIGADYLPYDRNAFAEAFGRYDRIIALMSAGIAVRAVAPLLRDKWVDPAVVVVSPDLRFAVPLVGGHHGANDLARQLGDLGMIPVLSTATETAGRPSVEGIARDQERVVLTRDATRAVNAALLDGTVPVVPVAGPALVIADPGVAILLRPGAYVVGVGCRRGVAADEVRSAIEQALDSAGISPDKVLAYATTTHKQHERGLAEAVVSLGGTLVFVDDAAINRQDALSPSRAALIGLSGVAEPAALALARHGDLVMKKTIFGSVTIAIAR
ncbi:MAG: cobalt-precorrin 5A hydrolase [Methanomicrobiaceae archaeon]|nr:cobalt-precorrin 5A hydrolase [Methanomicrobiaceae archaeon]